MWNQHHCGCSQASSSYHHCGCNQVSPAHNYCSCNQVSPAYDMGKHCTWGDAGYKGSTFVLIVVLFILLIIVGSVYR